MGDASSARDLVAGVLADLGMGSVGWHVTDVAPAEGTPEPPRADLSSTTHLLITVGGSRGSFQVYATNGIERAQADVATVEQVQDHVIELLGGAALPPCPGHAHPLQPRVLDSEPMWVCPRDPEHHRAPVTGAR